MLLTFDVGSALEFEISLHVTSLFFASEPSVAFSVVILPIGDDLNPDHAPLLPCTQGWVAKALAPALIGSSAVWPHVANER